MSSLPASPPVADLTEPTDPTGSAAGPLHPHDFLDCLPVYVAVMRPDGTLVRLNRAAAETLDPAAGDRIGRPVWACGWWRGIPAMQARIRDAVACAAAGQAQRFDCEIQTRCGHRFVEQHVGPLTDPSGRIAGVIATGVDIDARRRTERAIAAVADATPSFLYLKDRAGRMVWCNRAVLDALGRPAEQVFGRTDEEFSGPGARTDAVVSHDREVMESGRTLMLEEAIEGVGSLFLSIKTPWRDERGEVIGLVGVSSDVTEQRRAEQALADSEERFGLAVQSSSLGTWDLDPQTMQVRWSDNARSMFGIAGREDVTLAEPISLIHPDDRPQVEAAIAAALDPAGSGNYEQQCRVVWPDGTVRWLDAVGVAKFEGEGAARHAVRLAGVLWDVTEQQRLVDSLREADRRKDEFLAMLAHELRNPLAPLVNAHRLLARSAALTAADRAALTMAQRQTRQMQRLVDDLLEVGRITRGKIELRCEPMSVGVAVYNAVESVNASIEDRRQTLTLALPQRPSRIVADPARVAQILENLLHNASKYTPEGGSIRIEVEDAPEHVMVRVADDGCGIEPAKLEHIFELFTQADATFDRGAGGLGIGLALVRRLVELHGGSVSAHSAGRGLGSVFTVILPRGGAVPVEVAPQG